MCVSAYPLMSTSVENSRNSTVFARSANAVMAAEEEEEVAAEVAAEAVGKWHFQRA
jgi:hypothetical protein